MSKWTNFRDRLVSRFLSWLRDITGWDESGAPAEDFVPAPAPRPDPPRPADSEYDEVAFDELVWDRGGTNCSGASAEPGVVIGGLQASGSGLRYHWESGGCEALGASGPSDADCLACFFVRVEGGKWHGGKFEWISSDRLSRGFANILTGYHGWARSDLSAATASAFVIVSRDRQRRSNTIIQEGELL